MEIKEFDIFCIDINDELIKEIEESIKELNIKEPVNVRNLKQSYNTLAYRGLHKNDIAVYSYVELKDKLPIIGISKITKGSMLTGFSILNRCIGIDNTVDNNIIDDIISSIRTSKKYFNKIN